MGLRRLPPSSKATARISPRFRMTFLCGIALAIVLVIRSERNLRSRSVSESFSSVPLTEVLLDNASKATSQRSLNQEPGYVVKNKLEGALNGETGYGNSKSKVEFGETAHDQTTYITSSLPIIDMISIGSILKPEWQMAQLRTFAAHPSVRNYFRVTEHNDTDVTCSTNFTDDQLRSVIQFCNNTEPDIQSFDSMIIRKKLFWPKRHTGWLCAQKRPIDGLYLALRSYDRRYASSLPSFLVIMDDDTFINMDAMIETTLSTYDIEKSHVVAGCRFTYPRKIQFAFAYGGFGTFLTKAAIQRLLEPIYCNHDKHDDPSPFVKWACWRLDQNLLGETDMFQQGMSLGTLMYQYAAQLPFTGVAWWNTTGYCLHSDHALGYFFNYYHVGVPESILVKQDYADKIRMEYSYEFMVGGQECAHEKNSCLPDHRICHYVRPERMDEIYAKQQETPSFGQGAVDVAQRLK